MSSRRVSLTWQDKNPSHDEGSPFHAFRTEHGQIFNGDNLSVLRSLATSLGPSVALAYMDPPFLTNRMHEVKRRREGAPVSEPRLRIPAFDDRWSGHADYLEHLEPRLRAVRDLLLPDGCVVIHVDPKTSHYVKVLADDIFGCDAFASEIVWRYRRWPSKTPNFQRVHDVLLRYRRDPARKPRFRTLYEPLAPSTVATWGTGKQRAVVEEGGRRARSSTTQEKTPGVPMGDVWDIGVIAPVSRERTGYPSQKPEALLSRLVEALSFPGDLVLDPYAGSGTTLAVAHRLGRRFVGIDKGDVALATMRARFHALGSPLVAEDAPKPLISGPRRSEQPKVA